MGLCLLAPLDPSQRMWSGRGLIQRVAFAKATNPTDVFQTLLKCCEPANPTALTAFTVLRAPRIVLGLGTISNAEDTDANSQHEYVLARVKLNLPVQHRDALWVGWGN
jgi:hypothetical protein